MNKLSVSLSLVLILGLLPCLGDGPALRSRGFAQSRGPAQTKPPIKQYSITSNESMAMLTVRYLATAEAIYQSTTGLGRDFATWKQLIAEGLIKEELAGGVRNGYRFRLDATPATATLPSTFTIMATPLEYGVTGIRSFSLDEQYVMRETYARNARLTDMQPIIHACGSIECDEAAAVGTLRLLGTAEATYQSTAGLGRDFGTMEQMWEHQIINEVLAQGVMNGYLFRVRAVPSSATAPSSFEISAVPMEYGVTGRLSYYTNETYVVRGADKGGAEASVNDPPVDPPCL